MTVKLSKQTLLTSLSLGLRVTPMALSLLVSSHAFGQSVPNRYEQYRSSVQYLPSVQASPAPSYPSGVPSVSSAPQATNSYAIPLGHSEALPAPLRQNPALATPAVTGSEIHHHQHPDAAAGRNSIATPRMSYPQRTNGQTLAPGSQSMNQSPSSSAKPRVLQSPNFADVKEVGRGLGTPGLITPGSVERMEQSGLVVEDFRPPQPRQEDFSLEGLPPEARRAFYDQLQLPEGGRVMSARVLSAETATSPAVPLPTVEPTPIVDSPREAVQSAPNALAIPALPVQDQGTDAVIASTPDIHATNNPAPVTPPSVTPVPSITPEAMDNTKSSEQAPTMETQFSKQHEEMQTKVKVLSEQNAALEAMVNAMTERLSKLEQAHREMEKHLETALKSKEADEEILKSNKSEVPQIEKDKAPEKKGKKKPKDRVEV